MAGAHVRLPYSRRGNADHPSKFAGTLPIFTGVVEKRPRKGQQLKNQKTTQNKN